MHGHDYRLSRAGAPHPQGRHGGGQPMRVDDIEAGFLSDAMSNGARQQAGNQVGEHKRRVRFDARMPTSPKPRNTDYLAIREPFARWGLHRGDERLIGEQRHANVPPRQRGYERVNVRLGPSAIGRGERGQDQHVPVLGRAAVASCRDRRHVSVAGPCNRPRIMATVTPALTATATGPPNRWRCSEDHAAIPITVPASKATATPMAR